MKVLNITLQSFFLLCLVIGTVTVALIQEIMLVPLMLNFSFNGLAALALTALFHLPINALDALDLDVFPLVPPSTIFSLSLLP